MGLLLGVLPLVLSWWQGILIVELVFELLHDLELWFLFHTQATLCVCQWDGYVQVLSGSMNTVYTDTCCWRTICTGLDVWGRMICRILIWSTLYLNERRNKGLFLFCCNAQFGNMGIFFLSWGAWLFRYCGYQVVEVKAEKLATAGRVTGVLFSLIVQKSFSS